MLFSPAQRLASLTAMLASGLAAQVPSPPQAPPGPPNPQAPVPPEGQVMPVPSAAQTPAGPPDLQSKTYSFAAEDVPIPLTKVPGQIRVFVLEDIQRSGARNLGEFLAGEMPAEYAQQGGPGLPTQAYQGGARPVDTVVTLDGVRVND